LKAFVFGAIVLVALGAVVAFFIYRFFSTMIGEVMNEETFELSRPSSFDPFGDLKEVIAGVGRPSARLVSIEATGVRSDGTMDLTAKYQPAPRASYEFIEETDEGKEKMPPVGAGRKPDDVWARVLKAEAYRPGQRSYVQKTGGNINAKYWHTNQGVTVKPDSPRAQALPSALPAPSLSTREMWEKALSMGAPKDAVATVSYDAKGYEFSITGTGLSLRWEADGTFDDLRSTPRE